MEKTSIDSVLHEQYRIEIEAATEQARATPVGEQVSKLEQAVIETPEHGLEAVAEPEVAPSYAFSVQPYTHAENSTEYENYVVEVQEPAAELDMTAKSASYCFTAAEGKILSCVLDENSNAQWKNLTGVGLADHHLDQHQKASVKQFKDLNPQYSFLMYALGNIIIS